MKRWISGIFVLALGMSATVPAQEPRPLPFPTGEPPLASPDAAPANDARPESTPRPYAQEIPRVALPPQQPAPFPLQPQAQPLQPAQFQTPTPMPANPELPKPLPATPRGDEPFFPPTPAVQLRLSAPATIANGQEVVYRVLIENPTRAAANHVKVRVPILADAPLLKSTPEVTSRDKELVWEFGTLDAGAKKEITIVLTPTATATDLKMCARVSFEHGQCVTTKLAKPALSLKQDAPIEAVLFDPLTYKLEITNPSPVEVTNIRLVQQLADGLEFEPSTITPTTSTGILDVQTNALRTERTWSLGTLKSGQKRIVEYRIIPKKIGQFQTKMSLNAGGVKEEKTGNLNVLEPKLGLKVTGPELAFVNQPTTYQVVVNNLGTATLNNVRVSAAIPAGSEATRISNEGQVFRDQVQWIIPKLQPGDSRTLTLAVRTPNTGMKRITVGVRADRGLEQRAEVETRFDGIAALNWKFDSDPAVARVGDEIRYTVRITNTGTGPATNVVLRSEFPPSVQFRDSQPAPAAVGNGVVSFPAQTIPAGQTATFTLRVSAVKADQARFEFRMSADHIDKANPVKSEPTTTINAP